MGTLVGYKPSALVKDFRSLKEEIEEEGLFEVKRALVEKKSGFWVRRFLNHRSRVFSGGGAGFV